MCKLLWKNVVEYDNYNSLQFLEFVGSYHTSPMTNADYANTMSDIDIDF